MFFQIFKGILALGLSQHFTSLAQVDQDKSVVSDVTETQISYLDQSKNLVIHTQCNSPCAEIFTKLVEIEHKFH